jgi:rhodanese-related sulfurtransferase
MVFPFRSILAEAGTLVLAGALLGVVYSGVTSKGYFRNDAPVESVAGAVPIAFEEAQRLHKEGAAVFVDARQLEDFAAGRIRGAVNIPLSRFDVHHPLLALIPRDRTIVTYCDGAECNSSAELAARLRAAGYRDVRVFFGGWREWRDARQPMEP